MRSKQNWYSRRTRKKKWKKNKKEDANNDDNLSMEIFFNLFIFFFCAKLRVHEALWFDGNRLWALSQNQSFISHLSNRITRNCKVKYFSPFIWDKYNEISISIEVIRCIKGASDFAMNTENFFLLSRKVSRTFHWKCEKSHFMKS